MPRRIRGFRRSSILAERVDVDSLRSFGQENVMATLSKALESDRPESDRQVNERSPREGQGDRDN